MRGHGHLRRLAALAGPVYGELLSGVIASIISTFWVAGLGGPAVAAVTLAGSVENLLLGLVLTVCSGTSQLLSHALGARDGHLAGRTARAAWTLCAVAAPILAAAGYLLREPLARAFLDGPSAALAAGYLAIAFPGFVVFFGQRVADDLFKGAGDTRTPMRIALLSNVLLLGLDPLLIRGCGPVPGLGVEGAALALVASRTVALAVTAALRRRHRLPAPAGGTARTARRLLVQGLPFGLDFTSRMAVGTVQLALVADFGVAAVAGYGIGYRVLLVVTMAFYAVRQAAAIEAARMSGAAEHGRLPALGRDTALLAGALGTAAALLCAALAEPVTALFTDEPAVAAQAVDFLRLCGPYLLPYALVVALGGFRQGSGRGRGVVTATFLGLGIQLGAAFALARAVGVEGIWAAMALGALAQLLLLRRPDLRRRRPRATAAPAEGAGGRLTEAQQPLSEIT
ncbi:MATE family efflux transporter [Kitasatospora sp. NPDC001540]|uniref:MATE family efflux transporter n=1 Tax=Kitasatospora sp. NPDC001540 TaxID=3364014 RepID=UPI0036B53E02